MSKRVEELVAQKLATAEEALSRVRSGQSIFVATGPAEPLVLTRALAELAPGLADLRVIHLGAEGESPLAAEELGGVVRYTTFHAGPGTHGSQQVDHTPINVGELPAAIARGLLPIDVALVQVSTPGEHGYCNLGVGVDATLAAVRHAKLVIAQVNSELPEPFGDGHVPLEDIDLLVPGPAAPTVVRPVEPDPISVTIGRHIADLIPDGATLAVDQGRIAAATLRYLDVKRDLGIHTEVLTDDLLRLVRSGAVTNRRKPVDSGYTVATLARGSRALYATLHRNPELRLKSIDYVSDPSVLRQLDDFVVVHSVDELDLSGLARVSTGRSGDTQPLPGSRELIDGIDRSRGGFSVLALPSTDAAGRSTIVATSSRRGVALDRAHVDFVATEYGVAYLYGLPLRQRALTLISLAHPSVRPELLEEAKRLYGVSPHATLPPPAGRIYPRHYEAHVTVKGGLEVHFRPVRLDDAPRLQEMFHRLGPDTARLRFHATSAALSERTAFDLACVDYSRDVAIVGLVGPRGRERIIAEGRFLRDDTSGLGEMDLVVCDEVVGLGVGTWLANYLSRIAFARGMVGVGTEVLCENGGAVALLERAWPGAKRRLLGATCRFEHRFPAKEVGHPKDAVFVYSARFADFSYPEGHPFRPDRARMTYRLIRQEGFLKEPWIRLEEPRMVSRERLVESHEPDFLEALHTGGEGRWEHSMLRYNLGGDECPIFKGLFDYILLYCSATATAVDLIADEGANLAFNPLGGFHHAGRDHAEGFCYVNDAILAIDAFLARGFRVAYVDIDAHHGNGVQDAYYRDDRVLTLSLHESGKTLYPWGGFEDEIGEDMGEGFTINVPLPAGTDDEAYEKVFERVALPALEAFRPTVIVAVVGADTHRTDGLAHLNLTNNSMANVMEKLRDAAPHLLMLGGGGYNPVATSRAWTRMWAAANRLDAVPDYLLVMGGVFLGGAGFDAGDLLDMAFRVSGGEKDAILAELDRVARFHEERTLPILRRSCE